MFKSSWFTDFIDIIYPDSCLGCQSPLMANEHVICLHCREELPKTGFHTIKDNTVERIFSGRCYLQKATSYLYFTKGGIVQSLMHAFKYRGRKEVGIFMATMAARDLLSHGFFDNIDVIVPIPLHPQKLKKRGYNQSEILAEAISMVSDVPMNISNLTREMFSDTQTKKSRFQRWLNVQAIFQVKEPQLFKDRYILLVDDVITTGSTIEACVIKLENIPGIRISLFTLAMAQ